MKHADLLKALDIDLKNKVSGQLKTICPKCSGSRKNKKDPSLSVDIDEGLYNCHNCDFRGRVFDRPKKEFIKPVARLEKLSAKVLTWFEKERKISNDTLLRMKVTEAREYMGQLNGEAAVICFNYFRKGELVNIKFRGPKKTFKMEKDAELVFYNLDAIEGETECVIVEGEIDCLTVIECGYYQVVSVPNGASKGSQKLEYLDNSWEFFEGMKKVILMIDDDEPGRSLREELARRIGKEKCYTVEYPPGLKDPNEVFITHGKGMITGMIQGAREWPIEGIMTMDEIFPVTKNWFEEGYPEGCRSRIDGFDQLLTFVPGQLTMITGIPGHGKDEWFNLIAASLAKNESWPFGICGFEESPAETVTKLLEKVTGKCFAPRKNPLDRMTFTDFEQGIGIIDKFFYFFNTEDIDSDVDGLLSVAIRLVKKYGIKGLLFNPWNWIDHNRPVHLSETEYINQVLTKIIRFAKKWGVHVFIIAHTTKIEKDKKTGKYNVPTMYNISGSAHFYNKTHNGISIYRDFGSNITDVYVQKVKQSWLGQVGFSSYQYDTYTRQYKFLSSSVSESWRKVNE